MLAHAYPRVIAGTPSEWSFEREARRFSMTYSTEGPGGTDFAGDGRGPRGHTEIFIPARHFGRDYGVTAKGAEIVSKRQGGEVLVLRNCRGAREVEVEITDEVRGAALGCEPRSS